MICVCSWAQLQCSLSSWDLQAPGIATKKPKLDEEAITELLVADSDSESRAEVSDVEEEEEEQQQQILQQASAQDKPQAATSGGGLSPWGPPQGRNTNVHSFVGPAKGVKKS